MRCINPETFGRRKFRLSYCLAILQQSGASLISVINNVTDFSYFSFKMLMTEVTYYLTDQRYKTCKIFQG